MSLSLLTILTTAAPVFVALLVAFYAAWLRRARAPSYAPHATDVDWPTIDVVTAVFNEAGLIRGKLENLGALLYPRDRVRFIIVDGGSTDRSRELIEDWARQDERFVLLATEQPLKPAQLTLALRYAQASWIVVTDADARMSAEALFSLMTAARDNPAMAVIGSPVLPMNTHPAEHLYWRVLNWLRLHEWYRGCASMVTAPCYAFRRGLIDAYPDDAISDDVYITWRLGSAGQPIGVAGPIVHEIRGPSSLWALFRQKVRRGAGVLRECFRFLPVRHQMLVALNVGYVVRFILLLFAPLVAVSAAIALFATVAWIRALENGLAIASTLAALLVGAIVSSPRVRRSLTLCALLPMAAAVAVVGYPFLRRPSSFYRNTQLIDSKAR